MTRLLRAVVPLELQGGEKKPPIGRLHFFLVAQEEIDNTETPV